MKNGKKDENDFEKLVNKKYEDFMSGEDKIKNNQIPKLNESIFDKPIDVEPIKVEPPKFEEPINIEPPKVSESINIELPKSTELPKYEMPLNSSIPNYEEPIKSSEIQAKPTMTIDDLIKRIDMKIAELEKEEQENSKNEIPEEIEKPKINIDADSIVVNNNDVTDDQFFDDFFGE